MKRHLPPARPRIRNGGFTLIELSIALSILCVLLALCWPVLSNLRKSYAFESTARELVDSMSFARASAVADSVVYKLAFEKSPASFTLYRLNEEERGSPAPVPGKWGTAHKISDSVDLDAPAEPLLFFPNGTSSSATIALRDRGTTVLSVKLSGTMGYATIVQ